MVVFQGWSYFRQGQGAKLNRDRVGPPSPQVLETDIDGDISLYNPASEKVTVLNGTASDVWLLCDGSHSMGEIKRLLASSYQVEEVEIAGDIERTINELRESGLIT